MMNSGFAEFKRRFKNALKTKHITSFFNGATPEQVEALQKSGVTSKENLNCKNCAPNNPDDK